MMLIVTPMLSTPLRFHAAYAFVTYYAAAAAYARHAADA